MTALKYFSVVLLIIFLFGSCTEDGDTILINDSNEGSLTVKVVDLDDNPLSDAVVSIYSQQSDYTPLIIGRTDDNGSFHYEKLLAGIYVAESSVVESGFDYKIAKTVQISSDTEETVILSPFTAKGDLTIIILDSLMQPFRGLKTALILSSFHHMHDEPSFDSLMAHTYFEGVTDSDGRIYLKDMPFYLFLRALCYIDENNYEYSGNSISSAYGAHRYQYVRITKF